MVVFYLRNSRSPDGVIVPVTVALNSESVQSYPFAVREDQNPVATGTKFPNSFDPEGDNIWLLTLATTATDVNGDAIAPEIINLITLDTLHQEIEAALGRLGRKVDWGTLRSDDYPPRLIEFFPPLDQTTNVNIMSNLIIRLQDPLPAAGIDLSTLNLSINGFPVISGGVSVEGTNTFHGNIFDLTIVHEPRRIFN